MFVFEETYDGAIKFTKTLYVEKAFRRDDCFGLIFFGYTVPTNFSRFESFGFMLYL